MTMYVFYSYFIYFKSWVNFLRFCEYEGKYVSTVISTFIWKIIYYSIYETF